MKKKFDEDLLDDTNTSSVDKTRNLARYFEIDLEHEDLRFTNLVLRFSRSTRFRSRQARDHESLDTHARDQRSQRNLFRALELILILTKTVRELS